MSIRITLLRHGETYGNVVRHLQGQIDVCLSLKGMHQADLLGRALMHEEFTRTFTSDLHRADRTLYHVTKQLAVYNPYHSAQDVRLRERNYGNAQGQPIAEYKARAAQNGFGNSPYLFTPEGGETYEQFVSRIESFFNEIFEIADNAKDNETENILIVTHGSWLTACMRYFYTNSMKFNLVNFDENIAMFTPNNTGMTRFMVGRVPPGAQYPRVLTFSEINNYEHLRCECCRLPAA